MPSTCVVVDDSLLGRLEPFGVVARARRAASGRAGSAPSSSSCVPASSTAPWSTTTMRSASDSDERRCAMRIVVRVLAIRRSVAWISSSMRESTDEVASSSSRIFGSESSARASATRWR